MSEWSVTEPKKLTFDDPVTELHVRIVNGTVNVVGTADSHKNSEVRRALQPLAEFAERHQCALESACQVRPHMGVVNVAVRGALQGVSLSSLAELRA